MNTSAGNFFGPDIVISASRDFCSEKELQRSRHTAHTKSPAGNPARSSSPDKRRATHGCAFLFGFFIRSKAHVLDCSSQLNPKSIDFKGYKSGFMLILRSVICQGLKYYIYYLFVITFYRVTVGPWVIFIKIN
jgi:hypothetical protein